MVWKRERKILLKAFTKNGRGQVCWVRRCSSPPLGCESLPGSPWSFGHFWINLHWFNCGLLLGLLLPATQRLKVWGEPFDLWYISSFFSLGLWFVRFQIQNLNWMLETNVTAGFWGLNPRQERTASWPLRWLLSWSWLRLNQIRFCLFGEKSKNLKTSHSVTVREGWLMSANLAGLRTLNLSDDGNDKKRLWW